MTLEELQSEIEEKTLDLEVFLKARDLIRARVLQLVDSKCALTPLPNWSGTDAVLGTLDLTIHAIERTLEDCKLLLRAGLYDVGKPKLRLVTDEDKN